MKKLNFGCGKKRKKRKDWINADIFQGENVDKRFDFNQFPYPFKPNTFNYIYSHCVLEHLDDLRKVLEELWRISENNAIIEIIVPYYNHTCAFNEPDHKHWFNEKTFYSLVGYSDTPSNLINKFEIISQEINAKKGLRLIPTSFMLKLSHFIPNLIISIKVKIRVIK